MTKMAGHRLLIYAAACCAVAAIVAPAASLGQARGELEEGLELVDPNVLRVCADPNNMPFSNEKSEGFENKLAELFAMKLGKKVAYTFFPQATGFVRMTLGSHHQLSSIREHGLCFNSRAWIKRKNGGIPQLAGTRSPSAINTRTFRNFAVGWRASRAVLAG
jgi:hypothetical protein